MGIWSQVVDAIRWLVAGVRKLSRNRQITSALVANLNVSEKIQRRLERFFEKVAKVEQLHGAHTSAWKKIEANGKAGRVVDNLDAAEYKYLLMFKRAFDDTIKPIGVKAVGTADDTEEPVPLPDVPDVPELSPEEDDDDNLSNVGAG